MDKIRISKGGKKYIRREKAIIRKMAISKEEQNKKIADLYSRANIK